MEKLITFNQHRPLLFKLAYQMLGTVNEAEDIVQEAWLRWQTLDVVVQSPKAYLAKLTTRLCLDELRSARMRREQYVGSWLPEPFLDKPAPMDQLELADSLSFAFLVLLECLSPIERAAFLLREVFDYDYTEIAQIVQKNVPNCRQIVHRARQSLSLRQDVAPEAGETQQALVEQFLESWNQGNVNHLISLMVQDVEFQADGGGEVIAVRNPLYGHVKVARFLIAIRQSQRLPELMPQVVQINGQPGLLNYVDNKPHSVFAFNFRQKQIQSIFAVVNPLKLQRIS